METQQLLEAAKIIEIIKNIFEEKPNEWLPVIAAIGGAFIGGISNLIPSYFIERNKQRNEKKAITTALLSEIAALLKIIEFRKYLACIKDIVNLLKEQKEERLAFSVRVPDHYSRVYQSLVGSIGVIDPVIAAKIISFHQLIDSVVQDIIPGGIISEDGGDLEAFEEIAAILESAVATGREILASNPHIIPHDIQESSIAPK